MAELVAIRDTITIRLVAGAQRPATSRAVVVVARGIAAAAILSGTLARYWQTSLTFLYSDECFTWRVCRLPLLEMLQRVGADTLPPLHFVVLKAWMAMFGDAPWSLRMPSVLAGLACAPAAYFVVKEACRLHPRAAWGAALTMALISLNAVQITHSRIARPYPLAELAGLCATWLLLRALRTARDAAAGEPVETSPSNVCWWIAYGAVAGLFCLGHHFAFFTLAAHGVVALGMAIWLAFKRRRAFASSTLFGMVTGVLTAVAVYSPWLPVFMAQAQRTTTWFWVPSRGFEATLVAAYEWNVGLPPENAWLAGATLLGLLGAALALLGRATLAGWLFSLMFAAPWLFTLAFSMLSGRPLLQERYLLFANAGMLMLLGGAYCEMRTTALRIAYLAMLGWLFLPASAALVSSLPTDAPAMEKAMTSLRSQYRDGDVVTVSLPQTVNIAKYYAHRAGFDVDARVYLMHVAEGGQPIHTTSLHATDLLADGPHVPPPDCVRWWQMQVQEPFESSRDGWRQVSHQEFTGPPATREVAGSPQVTLTLFTRVP
jgi:hypothetical protein